MKAIAVSAKRSSPNGATPCDICGGEVVEQRVTYILERDVDVVVVENVPAKVCIRCGERLCAPETVERLQETLWHDRRPVRLLRAPVYDFAAAS